MAKNLQHDTATTRDTLATEVRADIHEFSATNVSIEFFTQTVAAQAGSGFLAIDLGTVPFGTAAISTQLFSLQTAATSPGKTGATTETAQSFAIYNRHTTPAKILIGTVGATTTNWDIGITGGTAIATNEKIKLNTFTYTASV